MNRLRTCLCAFALATLFASPLAARQGPAEPRTAELRDAGDPALQRGLERVVRDLGLDGEVRARRLSLAIVDVTDPSAPRLAMLNGDEMVYAASLPKVAILLGACVEAEAGRLPLDESRRAAMVNMIRHSSNEDATRVLRWVGEQRLLEILQSERFRFYESNGAGGLWVGKAYGGEGAYRRDPLRNLSHGATAYQVARLYHELATGRLLSPAFAEVMKDALSRPGIRHKFVKGLESRPGVTIYRKSGTWRDHHADSALVEHGRHRYVLVGLAEHAQGGDWLARLAAPLHDLLVQPGGMVLAGR
jgi:beta-lactamase class A